MKALKTKEGKLQVKVKKSDPLTEEARKYKTSDEFVKGFNKNTAKVRELAFQDTSEQIPEEHQKLHDAFMKHALKPEIQAKYNSNPKYTDKDVLEAFYNNLHKK